MSAAVLPLAPRWKDWAVPLLLAGLVAGRVAFVAAWFDARLVSQSRARPQV